MTGYGPALDFCDDRTALLIPARLVRLPEKRVGDIETVDYPWLAEPDVQILARLLRQTFEQPAEARARACAGRQRVLANFTWDHVVSLVESRLLALRKQPVRRGATAATNSGSSIPLDEDNAAEPLCICPDNAPEDAAPTEAIPRVSLCLIVRNEEHNLTPCLASVADLVNEIVIVDTGSTDATKEVAARFGAKIVDFPWIDSFAAARNESLRHATGQWIFWMDADDRLDADNRVKLQALFAKLQPENAAYVMKCLCLPDAVTGATTLVDHIRLFRNDPALRWEHRVHEQILPAIRRTGGDVRWADVVVHHAGYQDGKVRRQKLERDLRLLELEHAELGDHPFTLFNLGSVYQEMGRPADALILLRRSLARSHPGDSIIRKVYALIVNCHRIQEQLPEALAACREGRSFYPNDAELLFAEALLRRDQHDLDGAAACLRQLLDAQPEAYFASVDAGLRGYKARQNLGVIYRQQHKLAEAETEWRAVIAERPDFLPAWLALGELYLSQQSWPALEEVARQLEKRAQGRSDADVLRGRAELVRREFAAARRRLEQTILAHPHELAPRVILSHVLLQEDRDHVAAEQVLRDLLALAPQYAEARHNLAILLQKGQQQAGAAVLWSKPFLPNR